jgi:transposase
VAALRDPKLRPVVAADHTQVLRMLSKRTIEIGRLRNRMVCRIHGLSLELAPGGIAKEIYVSDVERLLEKVRPQTRTERVRHEVAGELVCEVRRLDSQLKASHRRINEAVRASGTSLTELFGVGPVIAAQVIGLTGDVRRFASRDAFAACNGTAPVEFSSGGRAVHRASRRGNRQLNHAMHMAAICQIRQKDSEGRRHYERKVAEGKTKREAIRALKRRVSSAVYRPPRSRRPIGGPGGQTGTTRKPA